MFWHADGKIAGRHLIGCADHIAQRAPHEPHRQPEPYRDQQHSSPDQATRGEHAADMGTRQISDKRHCSIGAERQDDSKEESEAKEKSPSTAAPSGMTGRGPRFPFRPPRRCVTKWTRFHDSLHL